MLVRYVGCLIGDRFYSTPYQLSPTLSNNQGLTSPLYIAHLVTVAGNQNGGLSIRNLADNLQDLLYGFAFAYDVIEAKFHTGCSRVIDSIQRFFSLIGIAKILMTVMNCRFTGDVG